MKKLVRGLVIGDQKYFDSWTEYRQVLLSGQYGIVALTALVLYALLDLLSGHYQNLYLHLAGALFISTAILLHRQGKHCLANAILYPSLITIIYLFTSSESLTNGGVMLYVPVTIGAFASFDYKHRKLAIMIAGFACLMFLATYFDLSPLPWRTYTQEQMMVNILINFCVSFPAALLAIHMLLKLNHRNAAMLVESNRMLQKSNEELDRFIYSTSHDLRAPLTSVMGLINISSKTNDLDELRKYLTMMRGRVDALDQFIKDITDYSRNSRTDIDRTPINLRAFAQEIWESLRYAQQIQTIQFEMGFDQDFSIETDPHRLRVILANLIANAIRYHDARKDYKYIRLTCKRTEKSFVLSVEDNGQGISPEYHQKIFQMFFRANESSTGSGLGLYIVQEAIEKLSGRVQLQSALAQGTTFTVSIPR